MDVDQDVLKRPLIDKGIPQRLGVLFGALMAFLVKRTETVQGQILRPEASGMFVLDMAFRAF